MAERVDKALPGDQPLPIEIGGAGTLFRFKYTRRAWGEYLVQVFVGEEVGRLQNAGSFTLKHDEMQNFLLNLGMLAAARSQIGLPADGWWPEEVTDGTR